MHSELPARFIPRERTRRYPMDRRKAGLGIVENRAEVRCGATWSSAEPHGRRAQSLSWSGKASCFMEPRSLEPSTGPRSPRSPSCLFEIHFNIILLPVFPCSTWFSLLRLFGQIVLYISCIHHACYMPMH